MIFVDRIKGHFRFVRKEVIGIAITVLILAFMLSFKEWGGETFDVIAGLNNFGAAVLIVGLGFIVHISAQKLHALKLGYEAEFSYNIFALIAGLILCFASNGFLYFLGTGEVRLRHMPRMRLGTFRYGLNYWEYAKISLTGVFANLCLAVFFKMFAGIGSPLVEKAILINLLIAIFSMIPIPTSDGINIFFGSKLLFAFGFGTVIGVTISLLFLEGILLPIVLGLFIGVLIVSLFYILAEDGFAI